MQSLYSLGEQIGLQRVYDSFIESPRFMKMKPWLTEKKLMSEAEQKKRKQAVLSTSLPDSCGWDRQKLASAFLGFGIHDGQTAGFESIAVLIDDRSAQIMRKLARDEDESPLSQEVKQNFESARKLIGARMPDRTVGF
ncbi:hypothetical protein [Sphingobium sufflavum]|uniref:hypothetical protein n=1 Tax=Sphingobium sufflavum TaxID=1129547 RepID=UPI001F2627BC|nr:hypothetical protein [Sphingobium sufflavum]